MFRPVLRLEPLHLIGKSSLKLRTMNRPEEGLKCRGTRRKFVSRPCFIELPRCVCYMLGNSFLDRIFLVSVKLGFSDLRIAVWGIGVVDSRC